MPPDLGWHNRIVYLRKSEAKLTADVHDGRERVRVPKGAAKDARIHGELVPLLSLPERRQDEGSAEKEWCKQSHCEHGATG